ncbi:rubredoxin [Thermodesulfobacterium hveragerdense]|uniref:rubredoxin n=1 Tax=Thermodesulfobacterium hveragerdense TaxID=53424 RepID=UPI0003FA54C2|nr:rubredoxin [Thermodesulfobacterium hveragerdense]
MITKDLKNAWVCTLNNCGYIYLPSKGDKHQHIPPNTPFEALPETWTCPNCGNAKKNFRRLKDLVEEK